MGTAELAAGDCSGTMCLGVSRVTSIFPHPAYPQHHCPREAPKTGLLPTCGMNGWYRGRAVPVSVPTALPGHHKCYCSLLVSFPMPTESVLVVGTALSTATHCTAHIARACCVCAIWALLHTRPAERAEVCCMGALFGVHSQHAPCLCYEQAAYMCTAPSTLRLHHRTQREHAAGARCAALSSLPVHGPVAAASTLAASTASGALCVCMHQNVAQEPSALQVQGLCKPCWTHHQCAASCAHCAVHTLSTAQACVLHARTRRVLTASTACTLCPGHCQCTGSPVREPTAPGPHAHVNYTVPSGPSISLCPCPQLLCPGHPPQPLSGTCSSLPQHPWVPLHSLPHLHGLEGGGVSPCWSMGTRPQCRAVPQASALASAYGASDTCQAGARTPLATPVSPACPAPRPSSVPSCRGGCWGFPPWGGIRR